MTTLELKDLSVTYIAGDRHVQAADHISLSVEAGESLGIVGESGSGKSTLAMSILRLHDPRYTQESGQILFHGEDLMQVSKQRLNELRWKEISVVFQKSMNSLSPVHRIGEQFEDIYKVHDQSLSQAQIKAHVIELFDMVNLSPRVYSLYPHELSGGMLQRISIALSLIFRPQLLIMDEATTALDVVTQGQILNEIKKLEQKIDVTRLMITHDLSVVATSCKKIIVMYAGQLMEFGYVKDVLSQPKHPYTQGLIHSFPALRGEKSALKAIPGTLPDLANPPKGCIFAPRCPMATQRCRDERPGDTYITDIHRVACHLYNGGEKHE